MSAAYDTWFAANYPTESIGEPVREYMRSAWSEAARQCAAVCDSLATGDCEAAVARVSVVIRKEIE